MAAAAMLAILSFEIDQFRMKEQKNAFWMGNSGAGVVPYGITRSTIVFQLYTIVLLVFLLLGYRGPMP